MYLQESQGLGIDRGHYFLSLLSSIHSSYISSLSEPSSSVENTDVLYQVWEVPKTNLEFNNLLVRLIILRKSHYSHYQSERIQIVQAKWRGALGRVQDRAGMKLPMVLSQWNRVYSTYYPSDRVWQYTKNIPNQGSSLKLCCPEFWLGVGCL